MIQNDEKKPPRNNPWLTGTRPQRLVTGDLAIMKEEVLWVDYRPSLSEVDELVKFQPGGIARCYGISMPSSAFPSPTIGRSSNSTIIPKGHMVLFLSVKERPTRAFETVVLHDGKTYVTVGLYMPEAYMTKFEPELNDENGPENAL